MAKKDESYNWLDDPFDERKQRAEQQRAGMSGGAKAALGCGCAFVVVALIVLFVMTALGVVGIMSEL